MGEGRGAGWRRRRCRWGGQRRGRGGRRRGRRAGWRPGRPGRPGRRGRKTAREATRTLRGTAPARRRSGGGTLGHPGGGARARLRGARGPGWGCYSPGSGGGARPARLQFDDRRGLRSAVSGPFRRRRLLGRPGNAPWDARGRAAGGAIARETEPDTLALYAPGEVSPGEVATLQTAYVASLVHPREGGTCSARGGRCCWWWVGGAVAAFLLAERALEFRSDSLAIPRRCPRRSSPGRCRGRLAARRAQGCPWRPPALGGPHS